MQVSALKRSLYRELWVLHTAEGTGEQGSGARARMGARVTADGPDSP